MNKVKEGIINIRIKNKLDRISLELETNNKIVDVLKKNRKSKLKDLSYPKTTDNSDKHRNIYYKNKFEEEFQANKDYCPRILRTSTSCNKNVIIRLNKKHDKDSLKHFKDINNFKIIENSESTLPLVENNNILFNQENIKDKRNFNQENANFSLDSPIINFIKE